MDRIQQIKTYLQNQKKEWRLCQSSEGKYRIEAIEEFLEVLNSLPEEPVNKDLEEAARKIATHHSHITGDTYIANDAWFFKKGAQWQQEQFEQNRLKACDSQTKEESEREWSFVEKVIHEEHRQPTYSDAIEYGRKLMKEEMVKDAVIIETYMMKDACDDLTPVIEDMRNKGFKFGDRVKLIIIKEEKP